MNELKPCPFCGGEAHAFHVSDWWVEHACKKLGTYIRTRFCETEEEAAAWWNTRAAYEMDGWFYLPKPKQRLFDYTTGFSFDDASLKATGTVDVYALADAVRKWQEEELNRHIVERICDVFKPERTCKNIDDEFPFFECSECGCNAVVGYGSSGDGLPNYCPNCGAKVVSK